MLISKLNLKKQSYEGPRPVSSHYRKSVVFLPLSVVAVVASDTWSCTYPRTWSCTSLPSLLEHAQLMVAMIGRALFQGKAVLRSS